MIHGKRWIVLLGLLAAVVLLYLGESRYLSHKVAAVVQSSYESYGENNPYVEFVSDEIYAQMCCRNGFTVSSKNNANVRETYTCSALTTAHWFFGARVSYTYSYQIMELVGDLAGGHLEVPVTVMLSLQDGHWRITGFQEDLSDS